MAFQLRAARGRGELDAAAAKVLAPERFAGVSDPQEVERIARGVQRNPGTAKENALRRVVDLAPRATNAKIQKLRALLKGRDLKQQPVVVFAHNLDAVREITEARAEERIERKERAPADAHRPGGVARRHGAGRRGARRSATGGKRHERRPIHPGEPARMPGLPGAVRGRDGRGRACARASVRPRWRFPVQGRLAPGSGSVSSGRPR